jgi:peptidyl-prolyl cis-trans isomerase B (cyclophilin B)
MPNRKTRDRQLAKLAARRAAERRRRKRNRAWTMAVASVLVVGLAVLLIFVAFPVGRKKPAALATHTPTAAPTASAPAVACGGTVPKAASVTKPQFKKAPAMTIDTKKTYTATMVTSCGTITLQLLPKVAPVTVNSFVFLADHHFFDGQVFHRIAQNPPVIQGGDPTGTGSGGPGYSFKDELNNKLTYTAGTLAMANSGPNTNGSQFFIMTAADPQLPHNYTIFGKVLSGVDIVQKITQVPLGGQTGETPLSKVYMVKVTIKVS